MLIGCKFRIYPTKEQEEILFIYCKYAHIMRNFLVGKFKDNLPKTNQFGLKDYSEQDFIKDFGETEIPLPKRLIKGVVLNYKYSVERVYKKIGNKPKFHKYDPKKQSFYLPAQILKINNFFIKLPAAQSFSIRGKSKIVVDKDYITKFNISIIKEPRFKYENGKWYITGSYNISEPIKQNYLTTIGLDWGIKNFMTTSTGIFINYPKSVIRQFYRINKLKSIRDKKIKGSNNWIKIKNKIVKSYERFENLKKDFIEQTTTRLCKNNNIAIEDLTNSKIKMSNKNRRRLIQINPLNRFTEKLKWKCKKFGTEFYRVNPAYTSQTCSCCGKIKSNLTLKDRVFKCSCGNIIDRDINAAINIARITCNNFKDHNMVNYLY